MIDKAGQTRQSGTRNWAPAVVAALAALIGFAAVYVTVGGDDNGAGTSLTASGEAPAAPAAADRLNQGAMTAFVTKKSPAELAEISFVDAAGTPRTLKDFRGRVVLLNLWATWCAPCREEMPALDRLERELGSDKFQVVALALDRGGLDAAKKFLAEAKVEKLKLYSDPTTRAGPALRTVGMPTTILIDADGREVGRLPGPAAWDSPEAKRLIEAQLK